MTREKIVSNFVRNLERERNDLGLTQAQMAGKLDISLSGYKKMIAGETTKIDLYVVYRLYELTGRIFLDFCEDSSEELHIFEDLLRLSEPQFLFIKGIVDFEVQFQNKMPVHAAEDYIDLLTPTGDFGDGMIWDSVYTEKINVAAYRKRFGSSLHCAVLINSHHLHPVYNKGDILLVSISSPRDGDTGIFFNKEDGRVYLRRFRQTNPWLLEPLNYYGTTFTLDPSDKNDMDKWIIFGKILSKMR